jgi:hypothetical protein
MGGILVLMDAKEFWRERRESLDWWLNYMTKPAPAPETPPQAPRVHPEELSMAEYAAARKELGVKDAGLFW